MPPTAFAPNERSLIVLNDEFDALENRVSSIEEFVARMVLAMEARNV